MTRAYILLTLLMMFSIHLFGQINLKELSPKDIPADIKYEGKLTKALQWQDDQGLHIVITSETGSFIKEGIPHESGGSDAELFAYHFLDSEDLIVQVWKVYDFIHDCELDMNVAFVENALEITDLNNDNIPEIWIMYRKVCRGDVSPSEMKIIMYEDTKKYAMRGETKVKVSEYDYYGGDFTADKSFEKGPKVFKDFAEKLWKKNVVEKWD